MNIEHLINFYVRKFMVCLVAYATSVVLDNLVNAAQKCLLLGDGVCSWDSLYLEDVYCPTK